MILDLDILDKVCESIKCDGTCRKYIIVSDKTEFTEDCDKYIIKSTIDNLLKIHYYGLFSFGDNYMEIYFDPIMKENEIQMGTAPISYNVEFLTYNEEMED